MAKRFTDTKKWRNEWFRTLPLKAKLAWTYLCDECDHAGILKVDWGLATFQLGFLVSDKIFNEWFGPKIFFLDSEQILIVQFFEFQYGQSKDTWSAKIEAKSRLETLGFSIINNRIEFPEYNSFTTVTPQSPHCVPTTLIRVRGRVRVNNKEIREKIEKVYSDHYPLKKGKQKGIEILLKDLSETDVDLFEKAVIAYKNDCERNKTEQRFIKHFSTFASSWRDCLDPEFGTSNIKSKQESKRADLSEIWPGYQEAK